MSEITVREETAADHAAVFEVVRQAFGQAAEAELVRALRPVADPQVSLVAECDGVVVGHIMFTRVTIDGAHGSREAMGLAPMAVLPEFQRRGVGSRLVHAGLDACRARGELVVVVLGHAEYYPKFGFEPAAPHGLLYAPVGETPSFMVVELEPGALGGARGSVRFLPQFEAF